MGRLAKNPQLPSNSSSLDLINLNAPTAIAGTLTLSDPASPGVIAIDTTGGVTGRLIATDSDVRIGSITAHPVSIQTGASAALTLDTATSISTFDTRLVDVVAGLGLTAAVRVAGNNSTPGTTAFEIQQDAVGDAYVWQRGNANLFLGSNNTAAMRIDTAQGILTNRNLTVGDGTQPIPTLNIESAAAGNPLLRFLRDGAQKAFMQYTDAGDIFRIDADFDIVLAPGNSPSATFDSSGNATFTGNLTVNDLIQVGINDTANGIFELFGDGTGSTSGGELRVYTASDHDLSAQYYRWRAFEDKFILGSDVATLMTVETTGDTSIVGNVTVGDSTKSNPLLDIESTATGQPAIRWLRNAAQAAFIQYLNSNDALRIDGDGPIELYPANAPGLTLDSTEYTFATGGRLVAGDEIATTGASVIEGNYSGANRILVLGNLRTSASVALMRNVRPDAVTPEGFESSNALFSDQQAFFMNNTGFHFSTAVVATPAIGTDIAMTERFRVTPGGDIGIATGGRIYFDGVDTAGDTYMIESAADVLDIYVGGVRSLTLQSGLFDVGSYTFDVDQVLGAGQDNYVMTYNNASGLISLEAAAGGGGNADTLDSLDSTEFVRKSASNTINVGNTVQTSLLISEPSLTVGTALNVNVSSAAATARAAIIQVGSSSASADTLQLFNAGSGDVISISGHGGTGHSLYVQNSSAGTTSPAAFISVGNNTRTESALEVEYTGTGTVSVVKVTNQFGAGPAIEAVHNEILASAANSTHASITMPHGTAPSSPVNGDMWTTTTGVFVRVNGVTNQLDTGGDVTKVGVPVNNQMAVWTGDGTIEGSSSLTFDGTDFDIAANLLHDGFLITEGAGPEHRYQETGLGTDQGNWRRAIDSGISTEQIADDTYSNFYTWMSLTRSGTNISIQVDTIDLFAANDITLNTDLFVAGNYSFDADQTVGAGQDNYVLTYNNSSGQISLEAAAGGGGYTYTLQTGTTYTAADGDFVVASNTGTVTITLPAAATDATIIVKKTGSGGTVTVDGNASETIDGATTFALTNQYDSVTLISDGSGWLIV